MTSSEVTGKPEKIAILGGGVSAITTAFRLTREQNWQDKYDITIYQLGWRIGGKGASGRNMEEHGRIEEHGIHVWFGFYEQAIKSMRECYSELNRTSGPLQTFDEAFIAHNSTAVAQKYKGEWIPWVFNLDTLTSDLAPVLEGKENIAQVGHIIHHMFLPLSTMLKDLLDDVGEAKHIVKELDKVEKAIDVFLAEVNKINLLILIGALKGLRSLVKTFYQKAEKWLPYLDNYFVRKIVEKLLGIKISKDKIHQAELCITRLWLLADFGLTLIIGMLENVEDGKGFDHLNNIEFTDWMRVNGASDDTLNGPFLNTVYSGFFAYKNGKEDQANLETGTFLNAIVYALTHSNGTFVYRMHAGMGDVVFAPYYEVLNKLGVKFKFFHKVEELIAGEAADGSPIVEKIRIAKQVELKGEAAGYNPLVPVKDLPCWPSKPMYDQIDDGIVAKLKENDIDLESFWTNWPEIYDQPQIELVAGKDFDRVVLGMSIASIPHVAPTLLAKNSTLVAMTDNVATVCTQAYQLWFNQGVEALGWPAYKKGELSPEWLGYNTQQVDNWASVTYLNKMEEWPETDMPKNISYFCGPFTPTTDAPVTPNPQYPIDQKASAKSLMVTMMTERFNPFMTNANPKKGVFEWQYLIDTKGGEGESRVDAQYWRANIDPSERYVQSVVGSSQYRVKTDESGFSNLLFTGDWIKNGFDMGCVESATLSGVQTAQVIVNSNK